MINSNEVELGILLIEDDSDVSGFLIPRLKETFKKAIVYHRSDFDKGISLLKKKRPDILILDLYQGPPEEGKLAGNTIWEYIWDELFVPIIVYTGGAPDLKPEMPQDHPFISCIRKGPGSYKKVFSKIKSFQPCLNAIKEVSTEIDKTTQVVLKDLSPLIWGSEAKESTKHKLLFRSARRRLGARMDLDTILGGEPLLSWEQYIVPPLEDDLLMGDIVKIRKMDRNNPAAYRLVLSPSCDLVRREGSANLEHVLVAKCSKITDYTKACSLDSSTGSNKLKKALTKNLRNPQTGGIIALPGLPSLLPPLAACLRDLELIKISHIARSEKERKESSSYEYDRVASVDSPFREQISWGFLQITCRPGLPERDFSSLFKEIQGILSKEKK